MCGIMGITGTDDALDVVVGGLDTLEYRGYDSAGVAVVGDGGLDVVKREGRLANLHAALDERPLAGRCAIGHTRWATHGPPSDANAHPHRDAAGDLAVVHNGIFENHGEIRAELTAAGHELVSDTDTEVVAHLIGSVYDGDLALAVRTAMRRVRGAFSLAVVHRDQPDVIVATWRTVTGS